MSNAVGATSFSCNASSHVCLKFIGETGLHSSGSNYSNNQLMYVCKKPFVYIMKGKTDLLKIFS